MLVGPVCDTITAMPRGPRPTPPETRFWRYVHKTQSCWLWTGGHNGRYGFFTIDGRRATQRRDYAHRFSYELHVGPIPAGMVVNHLCETPLCVRPDHLEVVTYRANLLYGTNTKATQARSETCKHGHPLDKVRPNGTRRCSTCGRDRMRAKRKGPPGAPACSVEGCNDGTMTRGFCAFHYGRWYHYGDPLREPSPHTGGGWNRGHRT